MIEYRYENGGYVSGCSCSNEFIQIIAPRFPINNINAIEELEKPQKKKNKKIKVNKKK